MGEQAQGGAQRMKESAQDFANPQLRSACGRPWFACSTPAQQQ